MDSAAPTPRTAQAQPGGAEQGEASQLNHAKVAPPPMTCPGDEQPACEELFRVDRLLEEGQVERARAELMRGVEAPDLVSVAAALKFEEVSPVSYLRGLVVSRALLLSGSLSFGQGDERSRAALELLERLKGEQVPSQAVDRLDLDLARAHLALGQAERAFALAEGVVARRPHDAEGHASLGIALLGLGRVEQSLVPLRRAQQIEPDEPERWLVLGTAEMLLGDASGAERSFRAALARASRSGLSKASIEEILARCYGNLGAVLLVQGKPDQGRSSLERALQLRPKQATYRANLAYAEYLLGNFDQAESEARKAIAADARLTSAWLNLGLVQAQQGKWTEARQAFLQAQALDPTDPRPQQSLTDLDEWRAKSVGEPSVP